MKRRGTIQLCGSVMVPIVAGCTIDRNNGQDEIEPVLSLFPNVSEEDELWKLSVRVRNDYDHDVSIHDISVVAFSGDGDKVQEEEVGDLIELGDPDTEVTLNCQEFPAVVSATAQVSPCEGAKIEINYWAGTDDQRGNEESNSETLWEDTYRKCDEPLPPNRVLEKVSSS